MEVTKNITVIPARRRVGNTVNKEEKPKDEVIIDPQTGEEVKPPDVSGDPSIDQETGMLKDLTQDDDYPSDILINVQPSADDPE